MIVSLTIERQPIRVLDIPFHIIVIPAVTFQYKHLVGASPSVPVILLDWTRVDLTPKSTPYAEEAVELQDSNMAPNQIYTINSKSWQKMRKKLRKNVPNQPQITKPLYELCDPVP